MRIRGNEEFLKWWNRWSARIRRSRLPNKQGTPKDGIATEAQKEAPETGKQQSGLNPYDKAS